MATLVQIRTRVREWLDIDSNRASDNKVTELVNQAIREIASSYDFLSGETSDTFVTVAGTQAYTLPSTFSRPLNFYYTNSLGNVVTLNQMLNIDEFRQKHPSTNSTAAPTDYIIYGVVDSTTDGAQLRLGPIPDAVYTITREYYATLAALSGDSDTNVFTVIEPMVDLIVWLTCAYLAAFTMEWEAADKFRQKYEEARLQRLIEASRARLGGTDLVSQEAG